MNKMLQWVAVATLGLSLEAAPALAGKFKYDGTYTGVWVRTKQTGANIAKDNTGPRRRTGGFIVTNGVITSARPGSNMRGAVSANGSWSGTYRNRCGTGSISGRISGHKIRALSVNGCGAKFRFHGSQH